MLAKVLGLGINWVKSGLTLKMLPLEQVSVSGSLNQAVWIQIMLYLVALIPHMRKKKGEDPVKITLVRAFLVSLVSRYAPLPASLPSPHFCSPEVSICTHTPLQPRCTFPSTALPRFLKETQRRTPCSASDSPPKIK
ncbi:hypothetical protein ILYODFUR_000435 [Ilyodon furcidens]|uniref:Uncharacterized protein n=1 Tax=Ilyodon furcidens TaxID=33524 RepID=A0ABV0TQN8_9TELE